MGLQSLPVTGLISILLFLILYRNSVCKIDSDGWMREYLPVKWLQLLELLEVFSLTLYNSELPVWECLVVVNS